jgi:hypothetical protein
MAKYKFMCKTVENPFTNLIVTLLGNDFTSDNPLVRVKACTITELKQFRDRADAAWEAVCSHFISDPNPRIEFEFSGVRQSLSKWNVIEPYIQLRMKNVLYRIYIDSCWVGFENLVSKFGDFFSLDVTETVSDWVGKKYSSEFNVTGQREQDEQEANFKETEMLAKQETDLFVISFGAVWSVDTGENYGGFPETGGKSYIFTYELCDYKFGMLEFEWQNENEILVTEYSRDEHGSVNVECLQFCKMEQIRTAWLRKLEKMYRDGRSNLPDSVFDHIMETLGISEERLQEICGGAADAELHYNSYGVQSEKSVPSVECDKDYPAFNKILSQDKVRDPNKLGDIVRSWGGKAVVSWKLDGAAVRLHYKGRNLVRAESKGKARDVTELMKKITGFPETIYHGLPFMEDWFCGKDWFVTGELVAINGRRSVSAGYLLRKDADSDETERIAKRLQFIAYDSNICEYQSKNPMVAPIRLYSQMINLLKETGFSVVDLCEYKSSEQIVSDEIMNDLPIPQDFDVDGLVVRLNDIKKYVSLGETAHHPKGSVAFKFEDEWKTVTPSCIYGKKGQNGVIKLIAEFPPLRFGDKTVRSAVWQPKSNLRLELKFNSSLYSKCEGYEVWYSECSWEPSKKFEECFDVSKIEVCLRGCVIPQWRLIEQ